MRKWKTNKGRMMTPAKLRVEFLEFLSQLPAQPCSQCFCGCGECVSHNGIVYCRVCGIVRNLRR